MARVRLKSAQKNNHRIAELREYALSGLELINYFKSRRLRELQLDLTRAHLIHPTDPDAAWELPKRGAAFVGVLAQLVTNWKIPRGPHKGEHYRCIEASNAQIAAAFDFCEKTWRREAYYRDGKLRSMPGTRAALIHHELIAAHSTTERKRTGWKNRDGKPMAFGEGMYIYEPGRALLELLGLHKKRVRRNRRRIAVALQRGKERRGKAPSSTSTPGNRCQPKAPEALSLSEKDLPSHRARATRARKQPLVRQLQRVSPVGEGVGGKRRRRKAQAAPPADRRHDPCSSPTQNRNEPDGHEGPGLATVGAESEALRQAAPLPVGEAQRDSGVAPPLAASGAGLRVPDAPRPPAVAGEPQVLTGELVDVRQLLAASLQQLDPARTRRELEAPDRPRLAGRQGELPGRPSGDVVLGFGGDPEQLVGYLQAAANERAEQQAAWRRKQERAAARDLAAQETGPGAALPGVLGDLFGDGGRTPDERAENERQREEAKRRARAEMGDDDDGGGA
jgi:hypothetical protein